MDNDFVPTAQFAPQQQSVNHDACRGRITATGQLDSLDLRGGLDYQP
jgi:hypothetical protein